MKRRIRLHLSAAIQLAGLLLSLPFLLLATAGGLLGKLMRHAGSGLYNASRCTYFGIINVLGVRAHS